jgi:hypothetical protein
MLGKPMLKADSKTVGLPIADQKGPRLVLKTEPYHTLEDVLVEARTVELVGPLLEEQLRSADKLEVVEGTALMHSEAGLLP